MKKVNTMSVKHSKKSVAQESTELEAQIDEIARDNPDLSRELIEGILEGKKDIAEGRVSPYKFG